MALVHKHLIIRSEVNNAPKNIEEMKKWLKELVSEIEMKILLGPYGVYSEMIGNRGLTIAAIIETSHIVMHTWDEDSPEIIQLDVYTCGPVFIEKIFEKLKIFSPIKIEYKFLDRNTSLSLIEENII